MKYRDHDQDIRSPLVCRRDQDVFTPRQQKRYQALTHQLEAAVQSWRELPDGYALRFPAESDLILDLAEFITLERRCCPFFRFALEVEPEDGPLWLRLTGAEGVKAFLATELNLG